MSEVPLRRQQNQQTKLSQISYIISDIFDEFSDLISTIHLHNNNEPVITRSRLSIIMQNQNQSTISLSTNLARQQSPQIITASTIITIIMNITTIHTTNSTSYHILSRPSQQKYFLHSDVIQLLLQGTTDETVTDEIIIVIT